MKKPSENKELIIFITVTILIIFSTFLFVNVISRLLNSVNPEHSGITEGYQSPALKDNYNK